MPQAGPDVWEVDFVFGVAETDGGTLATVIFGNDFSAVSQYGMSLIVASVDVGFYTSAPNSFTSQLIIGGALVWVDTENLEVGQGYMSWRGRRLLRPGLGETVDCFCQSLVGCQIGVTVGGFLASGRVDFTL